MTIQQLKHLARDLRYRPLPHLIGRRVQASSVQALAQESLAQLSLPSAPCVAPSDMTRLELALTRYRLADLEYTVDAPHWLKANRPGPTILREFGFASVPGDAIKDDTCLDLLLEGVERNQTVLKLFLHDANAPRNSEIKWPLELPVIDACLTNAPFLWFHKHFYL